MVPEQESAILAAWSAAFGLRHADTAFPRNPEVLEDRTLLSVDVIGVPDWMAAGPHLTTGGQAEGIPTFEVRQRNDDLGPGDTIDPGDFDYTDENPVIGAVNVVVAHPTNREIIYVGATNGGIWKTTDATDFAPHWEPLTDQFPSLSIGALEFDPTDASGNTLVAGIGRASNFGSAGGPLTGILRTVDGGKTWKQLGNAVTDGIDNDGTGGTDDLGETGLPALSGLNVTGVAARGNTIVVATNAGLFRTPDGGATWTPLSGIDLYADMVIDVVNGPVTALEGDPNFPNRLYAAVLPQGGTPGGLFRSTDFGASWTAITGAVGGTITGATNNIQLAVHSNSQAGTNRLYAAVMNNGMLSGMFWASVSNTAGFGAWNPMAVPQTNEGGGTFGLQPEAEYEPDDEEEPGGQGRINFSMAADPVAANIVYVGGDRQPGNVGVPPTDTFTGLNSVGASDYTGRLFRGDTSQPQNLQWTPLTHAYADGSAPHADSRDMAIDAAGDLIEVDDGGIYRRTNPQGNTFWPLPLGSATAKATSKSSDGPIVVTTYDGIPHGLETGDRIRLRIQGIISGRFEVEPILDGFFRVTRIDDLNFSIDGTNDVVLPEVLVPTKWDHGRWFSMIGDLQVTEFHDIAWDSVSNQIIGGAQDTGVHQRSTIQGFFGPQNSWNEVTKADGGDVAIDTYTRDSTHESIRYSSTQNGSFSREVYDDSGTIVGGRVSVFPTGGLPNFNPQFVTPIEVNSVAPTPAQLSAGLSTRIVIGGTGANPVYEANNAGKAANAAAVNWTAVPVAAGFAGVNRNAMAYGGMRFGQPNPDVLLVGSGNQVFLRSNAGGTLNPIPFLDVFGNAIAAPKDVVTDVVVDPDNWWTAVAVTTSSIGNPSRVYITTNAGAANPFWIDITGNLSVTNLRTVEFVGGFGNDAVLVGTESGVWRMLRNNSGIWTHYGDRLPNAPVWDLDYNATDNILLAGTLGRGAWTLSNVRQSALSPSVLEINGTSATDVIVLRADDDYPQLFHVNIFGGTTESYTFQWSLFDEIHINGLGSSDLIGLSFGTNPPPYSGSLSILGGGGANDVLNLNGGRNSDTVTVTSNEITFNGMSITQTNIDFLDIHTGAGADTINVDSTSSGTKVTIYGEDDPDTITVGNGQYFESIHDEVEVFGRDGDTLRIDDSRDQAGNFYFDGGPFPFLSSWEKHFYTLTADTFEKSEVTWTAFPAPGTPNPDSQRAPKLIFHGIDDLTVNTSVTTGDDFGSGEFGSEMTVSGVASGTSLTINSNSGKDLIIYNTNASGVTVNLNGGIGDDTIHIDRTGTDSTVSVAGGRGDDTFHVGNDNFAANILGSVNVFGTPFVGSFPENDQLFIDDIVRVFGDGALNDYQFDTRPGDPNGGRFVKFMNAKPFPMSATLSFRRISSVELLANGNSNEVFVNGTIGQSTYTLRGNSGNDEITVNAVAADSIVIADGGIGIDTFRVNHVPDGYIQIIGGDPTTKGPEGRGDRLFLDTMIEVVDDRPDGVYGNRLEDESAGEILLRDSMRKIIDFTGLEPVTLTGFASITFVSAGSRDDIVIDSPEAETTRVGGTSDGVGFENLTVFDVPELILDLAQNDDADPFDRVVIQPGSLAARAAKGDHSRRCGRG